MPPSTARLVDVLLLLKDQLPLEVHPDPEFVGQHPNHDCRLICSADTTWQDESNVGDGSILARVSDLEHQRETVAYLVHAANLLPRLVNDAHRVLREFENYSEHMTKIGRGHEDYGRTRAELLTTLNVAERIPLPPLNPKPHFA